MRWKVKKVETSWVRWFAWHPIRINDEVVWLEFVERKKFIPKNAKHKCSYYWEYK